MKLIDFLQGKWLGHPLHPAIVHVPVGAWTAACLLDGCIRLGASHPTLPRVALYSVVFGLLATLFAVPTGLAEWTAIKKEKPAWRLGLYHLLLNAGAAIVWAGNVGLRLSALETTDPISNAVLLTSLVGTALLFWGAYLGHLMAFDHGIGVARLSKSKWRRIAARGGARLPEEK